MSPRILYFLSLLFVGLALGPSLAHLLELPNKINLSRDEYLTVQQIYRGWALLGIVVFGALASTLALTISLRHERKAFIFALIAFLCIVGAQIIFWTYTFPANQITSNWTTLPENWTTLRRQWEFSHAAGALLNLLAFMSLSASVIVHSEVATSMARTLEPTR